ncbi:MAG: hypothetical protein RBT34_05415 [Anaerolineaceae bacterium]|jgi:hypothetical protein|nr:hypothetical protein [Anaerolineaceae bacterium]
MMTSKSQNTKLQQGRDLARQLYDLTLPQLQNPGAELRSQWQAEYPLLSGTEIDDVHQQVCAARLEEQERVGWLTVPHDASVLVFVAVSIFFTLTTGIVAGVISLIALETLFQVWFSHRWYRSLSLLVWLTYPAYVLLVFVLRQRGYGLYGIAGIVAAAWGGTFLLGMLIRLVVKALLPGKVPPVKGN